MSVFLIVIGVLQLVAYVPQIVKLIRTKKSEDLSLSSWFLWLVVDTCWVCHSWFYLGDLNQTLVTGIELLLVVSVFVLSWYYGKGLK